MSPSETAGADPLIGQLLAGKFYVERVLGAGAMGRVYLAEQTNLGKKVAIKVLHTQLAGDASLERRFHREARSASMLVHPNIVHVVDFGREGGLLYLAMELLSGRDLRQLIRAEWPLAPGRVGHIVGQVLGALDEAHAKGVVHRDLKPENVMLMDVRGEADFVKVCDFGIAKVVSERDSEVSALTSAGVVCGTPEYMSPEQVRGEPLDGRSDLYAVAVMLYEMASGELPFRAETALGLITKHLTEAPTPPSQRRPGLVVPPALEALILRGLAKDREQRFATAAEMKRALLEAVGAGSSAGRLAGGPQPAEALAVTLAPGPSSASGARTERGAPGARAWMRLLAVLLAGAALAAAIVVARARLRQPRVAAPAAARPAVSPAPVESPAPGRAAPALATSRTVEPPARLVRHPRKESPPPPRAESAPLPAAPLPAAPPPAAPAPAFATLFAEGESLFKSGAISQALDKYLEAARLDPTHARTQRQIGWCFNRLGQRDRAQPYLRRYLELSPEAPDAAFIRAMIDQR